MNEQTSKKIIFNRSTLLSLKAELLRKQEEVLEKKHLPQHKIENFKPPSTKSPENAENSAFNNRKTFKDSLKAIDIEESELYRKSKLALQKKTELYEHLSDSAGNSELGGRFLVDFDTKKQQETIKKDEFSPLKDSIDLSTYQDDENEWVEFTDCLGRTRKCLKTDFQFYKDKDIELMEMMGKDKDIKSAEIIEKSPEKEKPFLVQKTNDYLQSLREKWEEKEKELLAKDKDIHYQDLLFDEARIHGVGYYSFSTDESERRKQMEELSKHRAETLKAQKEAEESRKKRDELIAARIAAARARQRLRAGLPPEDPKENEKDFTTCLLEFLNEKKNEADANAKEEENRIKEEKEKERQKLREAYVREWDIGKEGVEGKIKKFKEMTQEEYVEQQRSKRIDEFAPPQASSSKKCDFIFDNKGNKVSSVESDTHVEKTWSDVREKPVTPPPPIITEIIEQKGLYFSTIKDYKEIKYKNFIKSVENQDPAPIVNEIENEEQVSNKINLKRKNQANYAEIAPPSSLDYCGVENKKIKSLNPFKSDVNEAYAQGVKSLETKSSNRKLPQHYDFTFD